MAETLTEDIRKQVFESLVNAQDGGSPVDDSRASVAAQFGIEVDELRGIEREGIAKKWSPL